MAGVAGPSVRVNGNGCIKIAQRFSIFWVLKTHNAVSHSSFPLLSSSRLLRPKFNVAIAMATTMKSLRIKTGSCKRLLKELQAYEKEVERETTKTNHMKDDGVDPHDLKQQESVLAESKMMIPDCTKRLEAAVGDLQAILEEAEAESASGSEELEEAKKLVADVEARIDHQ